METVFRKFYKNLKKMVLFFTIFFMKKFFIIFLAIFLFSCSQNSENISQKVSENTTKPEKNFQNIDYNSYYIGANILDTKDLKISKISAGSK